MAFLTIAGVTYEVERQGAREGTPERIGEEIRAFAGNLLSTVRAEKRVWDYRVPLLSTSARNTLRTAIANGVIVSVSGEQVGAAKDCVVSVEDETPTQEAGTYEYSLRLRIREV